MTKIPVLPDPVALLEELSGAANSMAALLRPHRGDLTGYLRHTGDAQDFERRSRRLMQAEGAWKDFLGAWAAVATKEGLK